MGLRWRGISADGTTWYEIQPLRTLNDAWQQFTVDLDTAAAAARLSYNAAFKIRFDQYDNYTIPTDGIAIDDISVVQAINNRLTLALPAVVNEAAAPASATITATPTPATDLVVALSSSLSPSLSVPASVTIPAGQPSVNFTITQVDDALLNGTRTVTIGASAGGWLAASGMVALEDNETATLSMASEMDTALVRKQLEGFGVETRP